MRTRGFIGFVVDGIEKIAYADRKPFRGSGYWPVALVASWPLSELPDDETFLTTVNPDRG